MRLTAKERILLHLLEFTKHGEGAEVPRGMTREGIAEASWIEERHVSQNVRPLVRDGLLRERIAHARGALQRRKVYELTESGRRGAVRLREVVKAERVRVQDAHGVREATVSEALQETEGRASLLDIVRAHIEHGVVDLVTLGASVRGTMFAVPEVTQLERDYDWERSARALRNGLARLAPTDYRGRGDANERLAAALFHAALQAESLDAFHLSMDGCARAYVEAREAYRHLPDRVSKARSLRSEALERYATYWLVRDAKEKKHSLAEAWRLAKESLVFFEAEGNGREYARTYDELSFVPNLICAMESSPDICATIAREAVDCGERALQMDSASAASEQTARICVRTAGYQATLAHYFSPAGEKERLGQVALASWRRARDLSLQAVQTGLLNFAPPDVLSIEWGVGSHAAIENLERAVEIGEKARDNLIVGGALDQLAYHSIFAHITEQDPKRREELARRAWEYARHARIRLARLGLISPRGEFMWVESPEADYYWALAYFTEADPYRRRDLLDRAVASFPTLLQRTEVCGYPLRWLIFHESCAEVLALRGRLEPNASRKRKFLEDALKHKQDSAKLLARLRPFTVWGRGYVQNFLADIQAELAGLTEDSAARKEALLEAVRSKEEAVRMLTAEPPTPPTDRSPSLAMLEAGARRECGDWLVRLFELTRDPADLHRAIEAYGAAATLLLRRDHPGAAAECRWRIASARDLLGDHLKASDEFAVSSSAYKVAAEKFPDLRELYEDLALYLQAWGEIEKARYYHALEQYGGAGDCYEHAAILHGFSKTWGYLAPNYAAWAQIERAEDMSRKNLGEEAQQAFRKAAELFDHAKSSFEGALHNPHDLEEERMIEALLRAAEARQQYCGGRLALEEARILDQKGEYSQSIRCYSRAAETFQELASEAESEEDRRDLSLICLLAQAWEAMAHAEADASPAHFSEAARLFEAAKDVSPNEKAKALALGHSRYCQALEAGTRFADSRDVGLHASAARLLESAAGHYARAGAESAAEFARSSRLLFDGYAALDRASHESDYRKKAMAYVIAEAVLESAAEGYRKAGHPAKRDQVLQLLDGVRRDRAVARSLAEMLRAPEITATTSSFATPRPSHERAVGVERFEHAEIEARVHLSKTSMLVGEVLALRIELVNAGRATASLVRLDEFVVEGFERVSPFGPAGRESRALDLEKKRLESLQNLEVEVTLRSTLPGRFALRPQLVYLDEMGESHTKALGEFELKVME